MRDADTQANIKKVSQKSNFKTRRFSSNAKQTPKRMSMNQDLGSSMELTHEQSKTSLNKDLETPKLIRNYISQQESTSPLNTLQMTMSMTKEQYGQLERDI